jgi:hypothetical protein
MVVSGDGTWENLFASELLRSLAPQGPGELGIKTVKKLKKII